VELETARAHAEVAAPGLLEDRAQGLEILCFSASPICLQSIK
jgi:hypothetical protein